MADDLKSIAKEAREAIATARAEIEKGKGFLGGLFNRWPGGTSKGGQFAPKGQTGGGGGGPWKGEEGAKSPFGGGGVGRQHDAQFPGAKSPIPGSVPHPQPNDKGQPVHVNYPSKASAPDTWNAADKTATFTPGQADLPAELNGIKFTTGKTPADWSKVKGQNPGLDDDMPFDPPGPGKSIGAGVIILEPDGRMWLTKPTNEFGGYKNTFPKGTVEPQLTLQQNAIKEAFEETGLQVKIIGVLGDFDRTTSRARFYIAERIGGTPKDMGWESQAVRLAPVKDAAKLLNRAVDRDILNDLDFAMTGGKGSGMIRKSWERQARWPSGSPLGGQWKAMGADGLTLPPTIAKGLAGSNQSYQKAINSAHSMAQSGNFVGAQMAMSKYVGAANKFDAGIKSSAHVKWGAQAYQYSVQLLNDAKAKGKATIVADKISGPAKVSSFTPVGPKVGGTNPGAIYSDGTSTLMVKGNKQFAEGNQSKMISDLRAHNEVLAAKLMAAAGAGVVDMKLVDLEGKHGGGMGVASVMAGGLQKLDPNNPAHIEAAGQDFAVNAWVGNWDALGTNWENTMIDTASGKAVCIDPGGSLLFRAQGALKTPNDPLSSLTDPKFNEFQSMRNTDAYQSAVYGKLTSEQLQASAAKLYNISDATIKDIVNTYGGGDAAFKAKMADALIKRRNDIVSQANAIKPEPASPPKGKGLSPILAPPQPAPAPAPMSAQAAKEAALDIEGWKKQTLRSAMNGDTAMLAKSDPIIPAGATVPDWLKKSIDKNFEAKDVTKLASTVTDIANAVSAAIKSGDKPPWHGENLTMGKYATQKLIQLQAQILVAAQALTPPVIPNSPQANAMTKPVFKTSFADTDKLYNDMAQAMKNAHAAGALTDLKKAGENGFPQTTSGKKIEVYHAALVADLSNKQAAQTIALATMADAALTAPTPTGSAAPQKKGALPNFDALLLPESNINHKSHNAKVQTVQTLSNNGDIKGLLSLSYGSNNYAKWVVKAANASLAALGSGHVVTPGQKKGANPALHGGATPVQVATAAAQIGKPAPKPHKMIDQSMLDVSKAPALNIPQFTSSSKAHINAQNTDLAVQINALYKNGNLTALSSLTFNEIGKEDGKVTGVVTHISNAKSKPLVILYDTAVANLKEIANPPQPLKQFNAKAAASMAAISAQFPSKPILTIASNQPKDEQLGHWLALGKLGGHTKFVPKQQFDVSPELVKKGFEAYKKAPQLVREFISGVQGGGLTHSYRDGAKTYLGNDMKAMAVEAEKFATPYAAGTKIYRWQHMEQSMIDKLLSSEPGTVIGATGPMCASWHPTCNGPPPPYSNNNFGNNRIEIVFAAGAKAVDSFGSGAYSTEREITTLPNSRFVLLSSKKMSNGFLDIKMMMLPPDLGITDNQKPLGGP